MINRGLQELDVQTFRTLAAEELKLSGKHLAGWLERSERDERLPVDDRRPWTPSGRVFIDFYETLYHVLAWYKLEKISRFKDFGWNVDDAVVENVKARLNDVIRHALASRRAGPFDDWFRSYDPEPLARYTAVDYMFQTMTGAPIENVLDFGSGIGRQAFPWCSCPDVSVFSVDAIESLYLLQNRIYGALYPERLVEYFSGKDAFLDGLARGARGWLWHLPTWQLTALPDRSFDLIICVQVLQELNGKGLWDVLTQFRRVVKKGGFLYIRDKEFWTPAHSIRVGRELLRDGWELAFRYPGSEGLDIEGIPRLWVYTGADNRRYFSHARRLKRVFLPSYGLSWRSWRDYGLPI